MAGRRTSFAELNVGQTPNEEPAEVSAPAAEAPAVERVVTGMVLPPSSGMIPDEPEFALAPADADVESQFHHYESLISRARGKVETVLTKAERYWRLTAGPALQEIRDNALYQGAGFASFERYVAERWGMSRPRAYQLIDSVRAMKALGPVTSEVPNERQLRAIVPVVDQHGVEAAQAVWKLAEERGRTSGAALEQAAIDLKYRAALAAPPEPEATPVVLAWPRYEPMLRELEDLRGLRQVAAEAPDRARELATKFRKAAAELEADLPKDDDA
uniref:hypothetical protein n=1 Tax=Microtetraspora malaysiensis TaxID=161358 RepID=UPI003F49735A